MPEVLFEASLLGNLMAAGDDVAFQRWTSGATTIFHLRRGEPVQVIAHSGYLVAIDDGRAIAAEADGTLVAIGLRDHRRTMICTLSPQPAAVVLTPEQIVWCTRDTRGVTGPGPHVPGQLWRRWRGTDTAELLGEHAGSTPELVTASRTPIAAEAITSDVYVAADAQLGVLDHAGLRWLATEQQGFHNLVCSASALYYTTHSRIMRRELATGHTSRIQRATIPLALAVSERRLAIASNFVFDEGDRVEQSALAFVDLATRDSATVACGLGRPAELAADDVGVYILQHSDYIDQITDFLTFVPWDAKPLA